MIRASKAGLTVCGVLYRQAMTTTKDMDTVEVISLTYAKKGHQTLWQNVTGVAIDFKCHNPSLVGWKTYENRKKFT